MNANYGTLLYLNPYVTAYGVSNAASLKEYIISNPSIALNSNYPAELSNRDPTAFFAMNAASPAIDVVAIDRLISGSNNFATPVTGSYVPNVYVPAVVTGCNVLQLYTSNTAVEDQHIAPRYAARLMYPNGSPKNVTVQAVTRTSSNILSVTTFESDLVQTGGDNRLLNVVLQGVYLTDATRTMYVAGATHCNALVLDYSVQDFNYSLYQTLYPSTETLTMSEAYLDYLTYRLASGIPRIGTTAEIAVVSSNMNAVVPQLSVTGTANFGHIRLGSADAYGISHDFTSEWDYCTDDNLVSERAIKRFSDRVRDMVMYTGTADNLITRSNQQTRTLLVTSNAALSNVSASNAYIGGNATSANLQVRSNATVASNLTVGSTVTAASLTCTGGVTFCNLTVTSNLTVGASVHTAGPVRVSNGSTLTANALLTGYVNASSNIATAGTVRASNGITTGGDIYTSSNIAAAGNVSAAGTASFKRVVTPTLDTTTLSAASIASGTTTVNTANITALNASSATFDTISTNTFNTTSATLSTATCTNTFTNNLTASVANTADLTAVNATANTLTCTDAITDTLSASSRVTCQVLTGSNLSCSNAVVDGRLTVTGLLTYPSQTYIASSNMHANTLLVDEAGTFGDIKVDNTLRCNKNVTQYFSLRAAPFAQAKPPKLLHRERGTLRTCACADTVRALDVDWSEGIPRLNTHHTSDELLAACIGTLQHILQHIRDE